MQAHRCPTKIIRNNTLVLRVGIIFLFFVFLCNSSFSQFYKRKINRYDENGRRTGIWRTYWDDDKKIPMSKVRFKDGYETGVSREYRQKGIMRLKYRYYKNRLRVKHYSENGKLEAKGWAHMEYNEQDTHFYFHGKWKYFDERRKLIRIRWYENGHEVAK